MGIAVMQRFRIGLWGIGGALSDSSFDKPNFKDIEDRYDKSESYDGWARLKHVFRRDSPERMEVSNSTILAYLVGFTMGGFSASRKAYQQFLTENKHTMFRHPRDAQDKLREKIFVSLFGSGLRYGFRLAALTFTFMFSVTCCGAYRNYLNPLDHLGCGVILGSIYTGIKGPKAALSGALLGGSLGLFSGLSAKATEKLSGETLRERWQREYHAHQTEMALNVKNRENNSSSLQSETESDEDTDNFFSKKVEQLIQKFKKLKGSEE